VITQAEASAALGQTVRAPVRGHATVEGGVACVYYGPAVPAGISPNIPVGDSVRVVLVTGPKAVKYFDNYRSQVNARTISGLGDRAFYDGYASISVLKGDKYVRIAVGIVNPLPAEKKLAADALTRM
jgi:lipopolysaccharide export system protein LptA